MRRQRAKNDSSSVSLFPFLAVLLCTMGALIVILVVIAHQARAGAIQAAQVEMAETLDDVRIQREQLQWQIEQLQEARSKTAEDLERDRLTLSHLEDHLRRLRDQLNPLVAAANALKQSAAQENGTREQMEAELAGLQHRIAEESRLVDEIRRKAAGHRPSYAVIPYEGPNRTLRRPIFIECRKDAVVLQPEGIVLSSRDFDGPMGPGNPLASALRAAREHLAAHQPVDNGEPYPLLLVRPDGIPAYYKARQAIESWGSDLGYELIGEDWNLEFPPRDERLAQVEQRAVDDGRRYQERLAMAAPSKYGRRQATYRASPTRGGFVRDGGEGGDGDTARGGNQESMGAQGSPATGNRLASAGSARPSGSMVAPGSHPQGEPAQQQGQSRQEQGQPAQQQGHGGPAQSGKTASSGTPGAGQAGFDVSSAAESRGRNWALPNAGQGAVPVSRPVRVLCRADRLVILNEDGPAGAKVVPLAERTEDSLDQFVSVIWEHMERWGIAGNGLYWRPILILQADPQGAQRARDLKVLLERSGMQVEDGHEGGP